LIETESYQHSNREGFVRHLRKQQHKRLMTLYCWLYNALHLRHIKTLASVNTVDAEKREVTEKLAIG